MQQLSFGLSVTLIGMLVVFVGLLIIIVSIRIIGFFSGGSKKPKASKPAQASEAPIVPAPAPIVDKGVTPEIIAAITAAISAVMSETGTGFRVRRVKRVSNASEWSLAGREDQIYSRM